MWAKVSTRPQHRQRMNVSIPGSFHYLREDMIMVKTQRRDRGHDIERDFTGPRVRHGRRHPIGAILTLAVCAMMRGARSLYAISQWGRDHGPAMSRSLGFSRDRTPSVATLHRVFSRLDGVESLAARPGFEPGSEAPKAPVLPLHHRASQVGGGRVWKPSLTVCDSRI